MRRTKPTFAALLAVGLLLQSPVSARPIVYVESGREVHAIDAETFKPVAKIPVEGHTDDVVGAPDGRMAFTNAHLSSGNPIGFPEAGNVHGIDTRTNKIVWSTFVDGAPHHMTVSKDSKRLFVPLNNRGYIYVLDTATGRIVDRWYAQIGNHGTELSSDGKRLYVGNVFSGQIFVYDVDTGEMVRSYYASDGVRPFKVDKASKYIYYQLSKYHGFEVRDLESGAVVKRVDLPKLRNPDAPERWPHSVDHGMAITPDESRILVATAVDGYVAVYSLPQFKLLGTIAVGDDPNWIRIRPDGKVAFVGVRSGHLSVIDIAGLKEIKRVPAGERPSRHDVVNVPER